MIAKIRLLIILVFVGLINISAQNIDYLKNLKSNFAKGENKEKYYTNLVKNVDQTFSNKNLVSSAEWIKALRDAQSIFLKNTNVRNAIEYSLRHKVDKNLKLQRTALEIAYTLYNTDFEDLIDNTYQKTNDPISYSLSLHYFMRINKSSDLKNKYLELIRKRFPNYLKNDILRSLYNDIANDVNLVDRQIPPLEELLNHNFQKGKTIIYSFHRKNRKFPGITLIKKPDGKFLRNSDNSIFHIPQLSLSYSDLPGYLPNGNTPQGIYSVIGWYISNTETIGPTPAVLVRSPFEVTPSTFYHKKNNKNNWNLEDYANLLPESWKDYSPIYNSYYSGKIGRRLIIIHGSTDETNYFKNEGYYPLTPTRGCLSSKEIWDSNTGKLLESDQLKLIQAMKTIDQWKGFLVVIELDNKEIPVKIEEIAKYLK